MYAMVEGISEIKEQTASLKNDMSSSWQIETH